MNLFGRVVNAIKTGGLKEVIRKIFWKFVYLINGTIVKVKVRRQNPEYGLCPDNTRDYNVIVSLTTYPERFNTIELCLKSLVMQNSKPNRIIVYLGSDSSEAPIPNQMKQYEKYGVEFRYDNNDNLKSHKKYFYAMQEFPNDVIVTADDDVIYPRDWLQSLLLSYENNRNCISARRVHLMVLNGEGELKKYNYWIDQYRKELGPSHSLIATGNSGVLYPPNSIDKRAFNVDAIKSYCFDADDIWLKCMALLAGTKYVWVPNNVVDLPAASKDGGSTLSQVNVYEQKNDLFLSKLMDIYNIHPDEFFDN